MPTKAKAPTRTTRRSMAAAAAKRAPPSHMMEEEEDASSVMIDVRTSCLGKACAHARTRPLI